MPGSCGSVLRNLVAAEMDGGCQVQARREFLVYIPQNGSFNIMQ